MFKLIRVTLKNPSLSRPISFNATLVSNNSAIARTKKVESIKTQLQSCNLLASIKYTDFSTLEQLRKSIPPESKTKLIVAKNTLACQAVKGTKWESLIPIMKGMNAWLFLENDSDIPEAVKKDSEFLTCGVYEGKLYGPCDFKLLETLPANDDLNANLLGSLFFPSTGLISVLQPEEKAAVATGAEEAKD